MLHEIEVILGNGALAAELKGNGIMAHQDLIFVAVTQKGSDHVAALFIGRCVEQVSLEAEAVEAPERMALKAAGVSEVAAENAVIEADGATTADEDDLAEFDRAPDASMCAAVAQKTATCEAAIRVKDVDAACRQIEDLAREYEAEADVRRLEDGGASVYLTLDAANAADLIGAIAPLNVGEDALEVPVQADDQVLQLVLTVTGE